MAEGGRQAAVQPLMNAAFIVATVRKPDAASRFSAIAEDYSFWAFVNPSPQRGLDPPALGRTEEIGVPTLIVSGEFDVPARREIGVLLDETIPDSRLVVMPGTRHLMLMEEPDAFNSLVSDFLTEHAEAR
jgi:2-hydroxy-6-oxonona-2,4-dienedioate hydrolase